MSNAELERAAIAPSLWIASSSDDRDDDDELINVESFDHPEPAILNGMYLVPGGRYLITSAPGYLCMWNLGYVGKSELWGVMRNWDTTINVFDDLVVQPTPDGLGIRILTYAPPCVNNLAVTSSNVVIHCRLDNTVYVFEAYPQKDPVTFQAVGSLQLNLRELEKNVIYSLNGNRVVIFDRKRGTIIVWDFIVNVVASWFVSSSSLMDEVPFFNCPGVEDSLPTCFKKIIQVTETTVIILHSDPRPSLWIFRIPPLTSKTPLFDKEEDLPELLPVLTFEYPDLASPSGCQKPDSWYNAGRNLLPLYFDLLPRRNEYEPTRYKLDIASDLSSVSLVPVADLKMTIQQHFNYQQNNHSMEYRICEDRPINCLRHGEKVEVFTSSTSYGTTDGVSSDCHGQTLTAHGVNSRRLVNTATPFSFCPASGRLAEMRDGKIFIADFV